ncbi:MAG TPA: hypothetical protein VFI34_04400 [Candidatus Limnocylindrales bacterium]|nr:hypothetical protein [Candidatus Limnocylindrales bacterium]
MRRSAGVAWWLSLAGSAAVVAGFLAILGASIDGMGLQPGSSLIDGYWVGLLPWIAVGTWLVPIGGLVAAAGAMATIWLSPSSRIARIATIPALLVIGFWALVTAYEMAPRTAVPSAPPSASDLQTVVYSDPATTLVFLLAPALALVLLAFVGRWFGRERPSQALRG